MPGHSTADADMLIVDKTLGSSRTMDTVLDGDDTDLLILLCYHAELDIQGHPTDLFLTISVLQRKFCWLGTEVSAVLLGSKVLNLRSRIYQMYQKFLLEIFYPSNLLEIVLGCISSWVSGVFIGSSQVAPLCARIVRAESRPDYLFTADQKICTWAPLLEI